MPEHFTKNILKLFSHGLGVALLCLVVYHDIKGQDLKVLIDLVSFLVLISMRAEMDHPF